MDSDYTVYGFEDWLCLSVNMYFDFKTFVNKTKHKKIPKSHQAMEGPIKSKK